MADLTFKLDATKVTKKLNQVSRDIKDFSEPFEKAGDDLLKFYKNDVFKTEGRAIGDKWKKLSPATLMMRRDRVGHYAKTPKARGKTLIWTGKMQAGFRKKVGKLKLVISNPVDYFKYHQLATKRQRKILSLNTKAIKIIMDRVNQYGRKILKKKTL